VCVCVGVSGCVSGYSHTYQRMRVGVGERGRAPAKHNITHTYTHTHTHHIQHTHTDTPLTHLLYSRTRTHELNSHSLTHLTDSKAHIPINTRTHRLTNEPFLFSLSLSLSPMRLFSQNPPEEELIVRLRVEVMWFEEFSRASRVGEPADCADPAHSSLPHAAG
jgi:hypothetical protein